MLQRFIFVNFSRSRYQGAHSVSDTLTGNAGQEPLEELVKTQALSADLREAVMACLCGRRVPPLDGFRTGRAV